MCTIGFHKELRLIFKNRDKVKDTLEEIVSQGGCLGVRTKGADYLSCAVNDYGCGFVSAAVNSPAWTALVAEGKNLEAKEQFLLDNRGRENPIRLVTQMLPLVKDVKEIIDRIQSAGSSWMGYNILLADTKHALVAEVHDQDISVRELGPREVVANHFLSLGYGPKESSQYPSSFLRYSKGNIAIKAVDSKGGLFGMLKPKETEDEGSFWRRGVFRTISSSVIDLGNRSLHYSDDLEADYVEYLREKPQEAAKL